jgi:hypothetical protein
MCKVDTAGCIVSRGAQGGDTPKTSSGALCNCYLLIDVHPEHWYPSATYRGDK